MSQYTFFLGLFVPHEDYKCAISWSSEFYVTVAGALTTPTHIMFLFSVTWTLLSACGSFAASSIGQAQVTFTSHRCTVNKLSRTVEFVLVA